MCSASRNFRGGFFDFAKEEESEVYPLPIGIKGGLDRQATQRPHLDHQEHKRALAL